jgi:hypothetical protein
MQYLDTRDLLDLTENEIERIAVSTGNRLRFEIRKKTVLGHDGKTVTNHIRTAVVVNDRHLKLDTIIETEVGPMTLATFWGGIHQKLRCQSTFRESNSQNGILGLHSDFAPFLYDNGTRIKYILPENELRQRMPGAWIARLSNMTDEKIIECWTEALKSMDIGKQRRVLEWVNQRTRLGLRVLGSVLNAAEEAWEQERIQTSNEALLATIKAEGGRRKAEFPLYMNLQSYQTS